MSEIQLNRLAGWKFIGNSLINSYSQMFFSNNRVFAYLILLASFANPYAGLSGLIAVLMGIGFAWWLGFDKNLIKAGTYSFNCLTIGLVMGLYFNYNIPFFVFLAVCCLLCVFLSMALLVLFYKYGLPILGLPFIFSLWILLLGSRNFSAIHLTERGIYTYNELFAIGGLSLVHFYETIHGIALPHIIDQYFQSLGAIYFQYSPFAGMLIALGLLLYSRIAFTLSLIGFGTGFLFVYLFNEDISHFTYGYIGFNYILAAISIGGFYLIPSRKSYLLAIGVSAFIALLHSALGYLFQQLQLPIFSLPSSLAILITLIALRHRYTLSTLQLVEVQHYSPEKNLYYAAFRQERVKNEIYYQIHPPFFGEWYVSQGYDGGITHLDEWKYALDFVVTDDLQKTFRLPGLQLGDFYCYNLPVLAPAYGTVWEVQDGIIDNLIGDVDVLQNWGNTIIIKHSEYLYSKLSHLKPGSIKVKVGDWVKKGDIIASCGSSGRSPEPHLHFQLQATPFIGSKTLQYPLSYFITRNYKTYQFHSFEVPLERSNVSAVQQTPLIVNAFKFVPGEKLVFEVIQKSKGKEVRSTEKWGVFTDAYNHSYLYCEQTKSMAYFVNNGTLHYFTEFVGDKNGFLYLFYLGAQKLILGFYPDLTINDQLPVNSFYKGLWMPFQDFIAPLKLLIVSRFELQYAKIDDFNFANAITMVSRVEAVLFGKSVKRMNFEIELFDNKISTFKAQGKDLCIEAKLLGN